MLKRIFSRDLKILTNLYETNHRYLSSSEDSIKKINQEEINPIIYNKPVSSEQSSKKRVTRKKPFKFYFDDEEREKNKIVFYEEFFDQNTRNKDRANFMVNKIKYSNYKKKSLFLIFPKI